MLAPLATSLVQLIVSSVVKDINGRRVPTAGGGYVAENVIVPLHFLNSIKITNYCKYKPRFNGVFSRNILAKAKDGAHVINLDDKDSKGTHWVLLFVVRNTAVYFDYFWIEYIPREVLNKSEIIQLLTIYL